MKKDNLNNQFRSEIFPIAVSLNGKYVDASTDITPEVRGDYQEEALVRNYQQKTPLSAFKTLTVLHEKDSPGQFTIEKLGVSQFACSSFLVGKGQYAGQTSLKALFDSIPETRSGGSSGVIGGKTIDETWRWTIATSQPPSSATALATSQVPDQNSTQYKLDLAQIAETLMPDAGESPPVVEQVRVFDLDRDGKPEVFGTVRKGVDPKSVRREQLGRSGKPITTYVNVWLSYKTGQPTVIGSEVVPYTIPVSRQPYEVLQALDLDGDGVEEVLVRNRGYESTSFGILELDSNQLRSVFDGANYGC